MNSWTKFPAVLLRWPLMLVLVPCDILRTNRHWIYQQSHSPQTGTWNWCQFLQHVCHSQGQGNEFLQLWYQRLFIGISDQKKYTANCNWCMCARWTVLQTSMTCGTAFLVIEAWVLFYGYIDRFTGKKVRNDHGSRCKWLTFTFG